jgi:2-dehydro-3-deoxygalactonokinase
MADASSRGADARLVALDWGTTSLRAYLLGGDGTVLERREAALGILQLPARDFAGALERTTGDWRRAHAGIPSLACGMIGSAQGWVEAPYVPVPASAAEIARGLVPASAGGLRVVPGVSQPGARPDVMRGEETQVLGVLAAHPELADALLVLPGTHSKWVRVAGGRIEGVTTYVTGELFAVLGAHSTLGRIAREHPPSSREERDEAFGRGVDAAGTSGQGLAPLLFSVRAGVLVGDLPAAASADRLSGLLIGDELRTGLARDGRPDALVGAPELCARYASALARLGAGEVRVLGDTAPAGLWSIAEHASLVSQRPPGEARNRVSARAE